MEKLEDQLRRGNIKIIKISEIKKKIFSEINTKWGERNQQQSFFKPTTKNYKMPIEGVLWVPQHHGWN